MHDGYSGEPHDGVFALGMFARRVSVSLVEGCLPGQATLDASGQAPAGLEGQPIMSRSAFLDGSISTQAQLFFRTGGTTGTPSLAGYTYRDYHRQMQAAADGLFAAGLEPGEDRLINLLYGGIYTAACSVSSRSWTSLEPGTIRWPAPKVTITTR